MPATRYPETAVARPVVDYFLEMGHTVYQEVQHNHGARADIVTVQAGRVVVVECKTSLSLAVIEQGMGWRGLAHWVYVATPGSRHEISGRRLAHRIMRDYGIGHIEVDLGPMNTCRVSLDAPLNRKARTEALLKSLVDEQQTYAEAGNARSEYWSPFRQTCQNLLWYVQNHPGCTLKEALAEIKHHYSTPSAARSSLATWIELGKVPGVRRETDANHAIRLYLQSSSQ